MNYPKNLKYPFSEFKKLVEVLDLLEPYFDLRKNHPCQIHYLAYQQTDGDRQPHNQIYIKEGQLIRAHQVESVEGLQKLVDVDFFLELYPSGCNDTHIETATKRAIKEVLRKH